MTCRRVKEVRKDEDGNITVLCNEGEPWSPRKKSDVIRDIKKGFCYFVGVEVEVITRLGEEHLRTTRDDLSENNLDNLPECKEEN